MSSYDGLQVMPDDGSLQTYYEAPIPVGHHPHEGLIPYEKGLELESRDGTPSRKPILGMRRTIFWPALVIVVIVIVAAAVGGGVGGSLANKKTTSSGQQPVPQSSSSGSATPSTASRTSATSSTSTASRTSAASSTSTLSSSTPTPTSGYTGCPDVNGTFFTASSGAKFMQYCNYEIMSPTELNFDNQATQNLDECIDLCDVTNE